MRLSVLCYEMTDHNLRNIISINIEPTLMSQKYITQMINLVFGKLF